METGRPPQGEVVSPSVTYSSTLGTYLGTYIYGTSTMTERFLRISQIKTLSRLETLSRHYQDLNKSSFMIKIEHYCSLLEYLGLGLSSLFLKINFSSTPSFIKELD
jgi:hypothetical protein